jgi:hypothetical protein
MNPESPMAKAIDSPVVQDEESEEPAMDDLLTQVDLCSGLPDDTNVQVTLGQLRDLLSLRTMNSDRKLERLELLYRVHGDDAPVNLKREIDRLKSEIDASARAEVEGSLYAAGIIEDPCLDGGLLG